MWATQEVFSNVKFRITNFEVLYDSLEEDNGWEECCNSH